MILWGLCGEGGKGGRGEGNRLEIEDRVFFPHSLGLFYLAFTQYLGFMKYGDEYKVMGMRDVRLDPHGASCTFA